MNNTEKTESSRRLPPESHKALLEKEKQTDSSADQIPEGARPVFRELLHDPTEKHEESVRMGVLLALSIGILNACTYMSRGHVFASSQSGNLLYLGLDFAKGEFSNVLKYLFPPLMFGLGVILAEHFRDRPNYPEWRKIPFLVEIILIVLATLLPDSWNALANPMFGLCCGLQTITFRKIRKTPVQTVFINGSFQNSLIHLVRFAHFKDHEDAFRTLLYFVIVLAYVGGIIIGGFLVPVLNHYVSLLSAAILLYCCYFLKLYITPGDLRHLEEI